VTHGEEEVALVVVLGNTVGTVGSRHCHDSGCERGILLRVKRTWEVEEGFSEGFGGGGGG
jgi:hypothetical protein